MVDVWSLPSTETILWIEFGLAHLGRFELGCALLEKYFKTSKFILSLSTSFVCIATVFFLKKKTGL